jgi:GNAT superfamily N-acetyltransferase
MLRYNVTRLINKHLTHTDIYITNIHIGFIKLYISDTYCNINSLYLKKSYRNTGFGSIILKDTQRYLKNNYNTEEIGLLAWQKQGDSNVFKFFEKNGYKIEDNNCKINTYDDYSKIYDLKKYIKYI